MKRVRLSPLLFRRIHKWVGLILGLQFVLWTISGAAMALLDKNAVAAHGHGGGEHGAPIPADVPLVAPESLPGIARADAVELRQLVDKPVYEVRAGRVIRVFDARDGHVVTIDATMARRVVAAASGAPVRNVQHLAAANLEARDHTGAMWRVNLADAADTSAYVSAETGRLLQMRGNAFRWWDFFWMLHNMDYVNRSSFNHPLIVFVAFGTLWLSLTGFYLLFKSFRRRDFRWVLPKSFLTR